MRNLFDTLADRLVGVVVPKTTAGACACDPDPYHVSCYCTGDIFYWKPCQTDCNCHTYCGKCVIAGWCGAS